MWFRDPQGTVLDGDEQAREELRLRAQLAISAGMKQGRDKRYVRVRLADEFDRILFEGTLAEAALSDLDAFKFEMPHLPRVNGGNQPSRAELVSIIAQTLVTCQELARLISRGRSEIGRSRELVAQSRRQPTWPNPCGAMSVTRSACPPKLQGTKRELAAMELIA